MLNRVHVNHWHGIESATMQTLFAFKSNSCPRPLFVRFWYLRRKIIFFLPRPSFVSSFFNSSSCCYCQSLSNHVWSIFAGCGLMRDNCHSFGFFRLAIGLLVMETVSFPLKWHSFVSPFNETTFVLPCQMAVSYGCGEHPKMSYQKIRFSIFRHNNNTSIEHNLETKG